MGCLKHSKLPNAVAVSPKVYYYINKKTNIIWWSGVKFDKNYIRFQRTGRGHRRNLDDGSYRRVIILMEYVVVVLC